MGTFRLQWDFLPIGKSKSAALAGCLSVSDRRRLTITRHWDGLDSVVSLGKAMERHGVGDIDHYSTNGEDEPHVFVRDPSDYVTWFDIVQFCDKSGEALEDFVIRLKFGLLD